MKALRVAPWLAALAVLFVACVPPSSEAPDSAAIKARPAPTTKKAPTPKNAPTSARKVAKAAPAKVEKRPAAEKPRPPRGAEKPKQAAETPEKKPVAKPSAKPQQPPVPRPPKPPKIFVFSPQRRSSFVPGETAQVTVVAYAPQPLPRAEVILKVKGEGDLAWTATDELGSLSAGRHSLTYGLSAEHFAPGDYSLSVTLGAAKPATWKFTVGPAVQRTHFPIAAWLSDAPSNPIGARRLRDALGFNMAVVSQRSAWRAEGVNVIDADYLARMAHLASHPDAAPLEQALEVPPFVRCGDLLTGAGLPWVSGCAVSGGVLPPLLQAAGSSGPDALAIGVQRLQHRLAAERRFANCIGVHLTEETGLEGSPEPKKGKKNKSPQDTIRARAQAYATFLRRWARAAHALRSDAIVVGELGEPTALTRGIYPPQVAASAPTVLVRAGLDSPAGTILSPFLADLARAGGGARRVWLMPQVARDAEPDELRTVISLALARKIDGVVLPGHMDYYLKRANDEPLTTDLVLGASGVNEWLTRYGDFLLALRKPRDPVAVFYSLTEHTARAGKPSYPWTVASAYAACSFAHFPAGVLTEDELLAGQTEGLKVIVVAGVSRMAPEVKEALEKFVASGGVVLMDEGTTAEVKGARRLKFRFPDLHAYHAEIDQKAKGQDVDPTMEHREAVAWQKLVYPLLTKLLVALKESVERDYTATDPDVLVSHQECGAARYIFVANDTQRTDLFRGLRQELAAAKTTIILREGSYALYDLRAQKRLYPPTHMGHPRLERVLPPGGLDILALLPEPIGEVTVGRARYSDGYLELSAMVRGKRRRLVEFLPARRAAGIEAAVPLKVAVRGPDGRRVLEVYRAYRPGGYQERLHLGRLVPAGQWSVEVTELLSGLSAKETFRVSPSPVGWASRLEGSLVLDGEKATRLLRNDQPLWIIVGTEKEAKRAEALAARLRSDQRQVKVRLATDLPKPKKAPGGLSAAPDGSSLPQVPAAAVVVGDATTNTVFHALYNAGVVPATFSPDYPGPGRGVLCVVPSGLRPGHAVVVAAGVGPEGADAAFGLLERAASAPPRPTRMVALPAGSERTPPEKPPRVVARLKPEWEKTWFDQPVAAATSPGSTEFTVAYFDGEVQTYDRIGKTLWTRRMPTRVRAIARSLDGAWVGIGSYPGLLVLTAQGSRQWAATLDDTSRRADFTALDIAPDGALTVAGTRRGVVYGYDVSGSRVFAFGEADADDKKEGWQSRLGAVTAVAISAKTGTVVVGARLGLVGLDAAGQELWASKTLKGLTALAWSYGETQTVAVGTRDGTIACLGGGGSILWQAKAEGQVADVAFLGTGQKVLAACLDGTLTCYDRNGKPLWQRRSPVGFRFVGSSYDGQIVGAADLGGKVLVCDDTGTLLAETERLEGAPSAWVFSPSGEWILVGTSAGQVAFFNYRRPRVGQDEL